MESSQVEGSSSQVLEKDSEASKSKKEKYKSLALKAKKVSSDEEASCSDSDDEEYAMVVRDFKKFFRRRGKFIRQPHDDQKAFRRAKEEKKGKKERRCFKCGDPNHFISDYPKHSYNDQRHSLDSQKIKLRLAKIKRENWVKKALNALCGTGSPGTL
nr:zf-CCHC domain-containing protein/UBN2 domain-containing protein [Tanacetum cinerariifolium]